MKKVFADTQYRIAIVNPVDTFAAAPKAARSLLSKVFIVTTDKVLTEFLSALSKGEHMRKQA